MSQMAYRSPSKKQLVQAISLASIPVAAAIPGVAAAADKTMIEEVVVTASRRAENVQDIPINITAVSSDQLKELRLHNISDIAHYVPGLTVVDRGPRNSTPDILVRGLNTTGLGPGFTSDTVASYLGEIPLQIDLIPVDMERVEVLIGPQGTLYGQGTMGGAIRYIPVEANPNEFEIDTRADLNSNSEADDLGIEYGLTVNIPLMEDTLALRVNMDRRDDPGFIDYGFVVKQPGVSNPEPDFSDPADVAANLRQVDDANGEKTTSYRANLRWLPTDDIDINIWYYDQETEAEGRQITNRLSFNTGKYQAGLRFEEPNDFSNNLVSLDVSWDLGFAEATFVYGESEYEEIGQRDQTDLLLDFEYGYEFFPSFSAFTREIVDQESETIEIRLTSQYESKFSWTIGYFENELDSYATSEEFTPGFDQFAVDNFGGVQLRPDNLEYIQITDQYEKETAFYGELTYQATDYLSFTVGYRNYEFEVDSRGGFGLPLFDTVFLGDTQDAINIDFGENAGKDDGDLIKFNTAWDINDDTMVYFTYSEGYRNGGVNSVPECTPDQIASDQQQLCALSSEVLIAPDEIENYEIGYKGFLKDRTISISAALYTIDWQDLQVSTVTDNGSLPITGNGSEAESQGFEFQGRWLINENWDAALTYAYTSAELTDTAPGLVGPFDALDGTRLPGSPEHQATFNVTYNTTIWDSVDLAINYGVVYTGDIYNIPGGDKDPLVDPDTGAPGDRGGEEIPSYDVHHLSATFSKDAWLVQAYVDNLTDEYYVLGTRTSRRLLQDEQTGPGNSYNGFTLRSYGQYVGAPRNMGVRVSYQF
ncbi:MAG: TonB-dependent receptor [Pseudomonadales bacterium]|jgi:outer membrane receptor protein involved in Fe transport|nr:TonB-dependent receptor [Pseudomonadales bacterium]